MSSLVIVSSSIFTFMLCPVFVIVNSSINKRMRRMTITMIAADGDRDVSEAGAGAIRCCVTGEHACPIPASGHQQQRREGQRRRYLYTP